MRRLNLSIALVFGVLNWGCASFEKAEVNTESSPMFDATLTQFEYPFEVKSFPFKSQQQDLQMSYMHVRATSEKKRNETAILFHGKNFSGFYWEPVAKLLLSEGYDVLIPDQIGFGKSSKPRHYQYSFSTLAMHTQALVENLGVGDQVVVGHSMGGMLATRYVLMYPKKVNKLILINPIGMEDYGKYAEPKDVDFFYQNELTQTHEKVIEYQKKNYYDGKWKPEYEALTQVHAGWMNGPDWPLVAWNNALTYDLIFTEPVVYEISDIKKPFYLILGTRDRTGPGRGWKKSHVKRELGRYDRLGKEWKKKNPKIHLIELEGLGHVPQYEDFARFEKAFRTSLSAAK